MQDKRQLRAFAVLAGLLVVVGIFWFVLQRVEHMVVAGSSEEVEVVQDEQSEFDYDDYDYFSEVQGRVVFGDRTYTYDHRIETWLLIGTDASGNEEGVGEDYRGSMADFLLLVVLDRTDKTYGFIQINRDTITNITMMQTDGSGFASADMQLCTAHWYGGNPQQSCENTVDAVSRFLGKLPIDGYYSLNMDDIQALNSAVGGVEVTVLSDFSKVDPSLKKGETLVLNDEQAYNYVHARLNVEDGSNTDRMKRQRQYMEGLFESVKKKMDERPAFLNEIYKQMEDMAVTTMSGRDLSRIMKRVDQGTNIGLFDIEGTYEEGSLLGDGLQHAEFYPDMDALEELMIDMFHLELKE